MDARDALCAPTVMNCERKTKPHRAARASPARSSAGGEPFLRRFATCSWVAPRRWLAPGAAILLRAMAAAQRPSDAGDHENATVSLSDLFEQSFDAAIFPQPVNQHIAGMTAFYVLTRMLFLLSFVAIVVHLRPLRRRQRHPTVDMT